MVVTPKNPLNKKTPSKASRSERKRILKRFPKNREPSARSVLKFMRKHQKIIFLVGVVFTGVMVVNMAIRMATSD